MKSLTICADDYGYSPGISAAIRQLLARKRLSCTSAMVLIPTWKEDAQKLLDEVESPCVGLHFDLITEGKSLGEWMLRSLMGKVHEQSIADALHWQIDAFAEGMGGLPDYLDSHQHVHTFPRVRDAVLSVLSQYQSEKMIAVRSVKSLLCEGDARLKSRVIKQFSKGFKPQKSAVPSNADFAGVYSFSTQANFPQLMQRWVEIATDDTLIMVHPGLGEQTPGDEIHAARLREFAYLNSDAFAAVLEQNQCVLG